MKTSILIVLFLVCNLLHANPRVRIQKPLGRQATAFAIFVDRTTMEKARQAIISYRDALEKDGLSSYIISGDWRNPEEVKQQIAKLRKRRPELEGMVFIGDIPVVFVRNAQHLTSAFKMNEKTFPFPDSSVPSDRFYDDLDLEFEFIRRDSANPLHFYYKLKEDGPQRLAPELYSGRIRYPEAKGGDRYKAISAFLEKVVRERQNPGRLDCFLSYTGSGYHSACLNAWKDEAMALQENFPLAWKEARTARLLNYRMEDHMKYRLLEELQDTRTDLMIFHEHGSPDRQYISDGPAPSGLAGYMEAIRSDLYSILQRKVAQGEKTREEAIAWLTEKYRLSEDFFNGYSPRSAAEEDSLHNTRTEISLQDLEKLETHPRFVILDACYNGSFHETGYVAGYYLFNQGRTVAVQGNTRNVLQDRWTIEMIGLLSHGVCIGQWNRMTATLEGHILGDPAFRFSPSSEMDPGRDIVLKAADTGLWEEYSGSEFPDIRSLAWRMLADQDKGQQLSDRLIRRFLESDSGCERLEILKVLSRYPGQDFAEAIRLGLQDAYEGTRRNAAIYAGKYGDPVLAGAMLDALLDDPASLRVSYNLQNALRLLPADILEKHVALLRSAAGKDTTGKDCFSCGRVYLQTLDRLSAGIRENEARKERDLKIILDGNQQESQRISLIRQVRNNPFHQYAEKYLELVANPKAPEEIRINMAEALGWFNLSYRRDFIRDGLSRILQEDKIPENLEKGIRQSINRLK